MMRLRAESEGEVGLLAGGASEEGGAAGLVVSIDVGSGAIALEVVVVGDAGRRASSGGVVGTAAAAGRVSLVGVDQAVGLAAEREAGRVEGALEIGGAVGAEILGALSDGAALVVVNAQGEIVAVNEGDVVVIIAIGSGQGPLGKGCRGDTSAGVGIAEETTIAATVGARVRSGVSGKVAVPAGPDTTSLPVVGDGEDPAGEGSGRPASFDSRGSRADVQVGEDSGPDGEGAGIVNREGTC
jgi:hypothetical protein